MTLLIGEEVTFSYDQLQRMMEQLIYHREWKTWSIPKPIAKFGAWVMEHLPGVKAGFIKPWMIDRADDHFELDITRAKKLIGWAPKYRVDKVIPKWVEELNRDPVMWYDENKLKGGRKSHERK